MKKFLTTFVLYDPHRQAMYEKYIRPRFQKYADMHGLKFIEMNDSNFNIRTLHPEFDQRENMHFNRWMLFKDLLDKGSLKMVM